MVFQERSYSVLLVTASDSFTAKIMPLLPVTDYWPVTTVHSVGDARRKIVETSFDIVLINAPFTREVHDEKFLKNFSKKLADHGAKLVVIWVVTKPEICHQRMIDRNSVRDTWKLEHWDEYVKTIDYSIPEALKKMSSCLDLMLFYNSSDEEYQKSMEMVISRLEDE